MKTQIEIDIPDGWEFVRWGKPKAGEHLLQGENVLQASHDWDTWEVIVSRWKWPDWIIAKYIAMDECGHWYAHDEEPELDEDDEAWYSDEESSHINTELYAFEPPPCHDWRQSKRRRPT